MARYALPAAFWLSICSTRLCCLGPSLQPKRRIRVWRALGHHRPRHISRGCLAHNRSRQLVDPDCLIPLLRSLPLWIRILWRPVLGDWRSIARLLCLQHVLPPLLCQHHLHLTRHGCLDAIQLHHHRQRQQHLHGVHELSDRRVQDLHGWRVLRHNLKHHKLPLLWQDLGGHSIRHHRDLGHPHHPVSHHHSPRHLFHGVCLRRGGRRANIVVGLDLQPANLL